MKQSLGAGTLLYPAPVLVVGTYDDAGRPNIMTAAWGGVCCSQPPCIAVSLRKATYTYGNIVARGCFTVSIPSERHIREADYVGMASGRDVDKWKKTGLTPVRSEHVDAPFVAEFPLVLECKVVVTNDLGLHTQFVGQVLDVKADESVLSDSGQPDIRRIMPALFAPAQRRYYAVGRDLGAAFSIGRALGKDRP